MSLSVDVSPVKENVKVGGRLSLPPEGTNFCIPEIVESDLDTLSVGGDDTLLNRPGSNLSNNRLYQAKSIPSLMSPQSPLGEDSSGEILTYTCCCCCCCCCYFAPRRLPSGTCLTYTRGDKNLISYLLTLTSIN